MAAFLSIARSSVRFLMGVILMIIVLTSCKKDSPTVYPPGSNENINQWIMDSLRRYYYWSDQLPDDYNLSQSPKDFFKSIQHQADRFSYILLRGDRSTWPPNVKSSYGFDYSTVQTSGGSVFGVVKMIFRDSPASRRGLKRGDYFISINGKRITSQNASALQQELLTGTRVTLGMADYNNDQLTEKETVEMTTGAVFEQYPAAIVFPTNSTKTGYLYIPDFSAGLAAALYNNFSSYKADGVTELILDLRYNSGGQVAEAAGLCAMIAPGINFNTPFITYKGNRNGGTHTESIGTAATFDGTVNFNTALQNNIGLKRIFILGTASTASAAEIMINNLKPFLQVILIGEKTRGKDEASFEISDMREPKQVPWEMHPIIYKLFNASGKGDYSSGINPSLTVNELSSFPLLPFGDPQDPLLKAALAIIKGEVPAPQRLQQLNSAKNIQVLTDTRMDIADRSMVITHR